MLKEVFPKNHILIANKYLWNSDFYQKKGKQEKHIGILLHIY